MPRHHTRYQHILGVRRAPLHDSRWHVPLAVLVRLVCFQALVQPAHNGANFDAHYYVNRGANVSANCSTTAARSSSNHGPDGRPDSRHSHVRSSFSYGGVRVHAATSYVRPARSDACAVAFLDVHRARLQLQPGGFQQRAAAQPT